MSDGTSSFFHPLAEAAPQVSNESSIYSSPSLTYVGKSTTEAERLTSVSSGAHTEESLVVEKEDTSTTSIITPAARQCPIKAQARAGTITQNGPKGLPETGAEPNPSTLNEKHVNAEKESNLSRKNIQQTNVGGESNLSACDAIRHFPRTVQWKIQWRLLGVPHFGLQSTHKSLNHIEGESSSAIHQRMDQHELVQLNKQRIHEQRHRATSLLERHIWDNSPFRDSTTASSEGKGFGGEEDDSTARKEAGTDFNASLGPQINIDVDKRAASDRSSINAGATVDWKDGSEGGRNTQIAKEKEQASFEDPLSAFARHSRDSNDVSENEGIDNSDNDHRQSQWREFYSNREMIDLIYKDLNRLPPRLLFWENSSWEETKKDSSRETIRTERLKLLADLLFGYAKEHPNVGYRQGMHEILAYVFLAFELDLALLEGSNLNSFLTKEELSELASKTTYGVENPHTESDEPSLDMKIQPLLLSRQDLRADAYVLFEAWMEGLKPAYYDSNNTDKNELHGRGGTVQLGERILTLMSYASADIHQILVQITEDMGAPPQLYCAKWMRLLFSREVTSRILVLQLWDGMLDILFDPWNSLWYTSSLQHRIGTAMIPSLDETAGSGGPEEVQGHSEQMLDEARTEVNSSLCLMDIIESAACSMILLQRRTLSRMVRNDNSPHECLNLMMNYPSISDISELIRMTNRVTRFHLESKLGIIVPRQPSSRGSTESSTGYKRENLKVMKSMGTAESREHCGPRQGQPSAIPIQHDIRAASAIEPLRHEQTNYRHSYSSAGDVGNYVGVASSSTNTGGGGGAFLSKVGVFLDGAKASAASALASVEERLNTTAQIPSLQQQQRQQHFQQHMQERSRYGSESSTVKPQHSVRLSLMSSNPLSSGSTPVHYEARGATSAGSGLSRVGGEKQVTVGEGQDNLTALSQRMESNLSIIRSHLVQQNIHGATGSGVQSCPVRNNDQELTVPRDVMEALEQLEKIKQNLALLGSRSR